MKQTPNERKIEIVKEQIKYCEEQLEKEDSNVDFLTSQLTLRKDLLKVCESQV
jgi:hypothetical protein